MFLRLIAKLYARYQRAIRSLLFWSGVFIVLLLMKKSWHEIAMNMGQVDWGKLACSILVGVCGSIATAILFNGFLAKHNVKIADTLAAKAYLGSQIAKYIPGKIWGVVYQVSHTMGGRATIAGVTLANLELAFAMLVAMGAVAAALLYFPTHKIIAVTIILLGMIGFVLLCRINTVRSILRFLPDSARKLRLLPETASGTKPITYSSACMFYGVICCSCMFAHVLMLHAVFRFSWQESIFYFALLLVAWIGGVLAFIFPAGMGVKEVLFIAVSSYMAPQHSFELLTSIVVLTRFWQIIQELICATIALFLRA